MLLPQATVRSMVVWQVTWTCNKRIRLTQVHRNAGSIVRRSVRLILIYVLLGTFSTDNYGLRKCKVRQVLGLSIFVRLLVSELISCCCAHQWGLFVYIIRQLMRGLVAHCLTEPFMTFGHTAWTYHHKKWQHGPGFKTTKTFDVGCSY